MALAVFKSPTTPGGAYEWLMISIGALVVVFSAVFYYLGWFF